MTVDEGPVTWRQQDTDRWLSVADQRERGLAPVLDGLLEAAALRPGESVLDVGCGTGPTTALAARAVRPGGRVLGLDLAEELVAAARQRVTEPEAEWLVGDASVVPLAPASFDVVLSRFGVMFFADPSAAFAHLAAAVRPGGRLAWAVWPPRHEVEMFQLPYEAARRALDAAGTAYDEVPGDRGPSSLGDVAHLTGLLEEAGWREVGVRRTSIELPYGEPGVDPAEVARLGLATGAAFVLLEDQPEEVLEAATRELAGVLADKVRPDGLFIGATVLLVTATRA